MLLAVATIGVCSFLAQGSTAQALASPGFAARQAVWLLVAAVMLVLFAMADYRVLARLAPALYAVSVLVLALMPVLAPLRSGSRAWLPLGGYTIQPSEFVRVVTILAVAALAREYTLHRLDFKGALRLTAVVAAPAFLVALQPDLGVALTYIPILLAALWLGGLPWRVWAALILSGVLLAGVAWTWYLKPYQQERVLTVLDASRDPFGAGYQQRQSQIAVGSGGLTGKGLHSGTQSQLRFLPAQHTDFIFAVWAEETGFFGSLLLVAAYALLLARIFLVAMAARDRTGALLAGGVGTVLAVQSLINLAMVVGVSPTTGITLPLMSYGGSSMLATGIALGMVQSVWRLRYANV